MVAWRTVRGDRLRPLLAESAISLLQTVVQRLSLFGIGRPDESVLNWIFWCASEEFPHSNP
jgi:hypothetical protein